MRTLRAKRRVLVEVRGCEVPVDRLPSALIGLRIGHITDLHFCHWTRLIAELQEILLSLELDVLAVTGDFVGIRSRWSRAAAVSRRFFRPIAERVPTYAILGNHDHPQLADLTSPPLTFLRNDYVHVEHGGHGLILAGIEQLDRGRGNLAAALPLDREGMPVVLLAHFPSTVYKLPAGQVDLMLAGHTHGGQIRLPGIGCLWPNDCIPRSLAHGLHRVEGTWLHVSSGVGVSPPVQTRMNCAPEVCVLTLQQVADSPIDRRVHSLPRSRPTAKLPPINI